MRVLSTRNAKNAIYPYYMACNLKNNFTWEIEKLNHKQRYYNPNLVVRGKGAYSFYAMPDDAWRNSEYRKFINLNQLVTGHWYFAAWNWDKSKLCMYDVTKLRCATVLERGRRTKMYRDIAFLETEYLNNN